MLPGEPLETRDRVLPGRQALASGRQSPDGRTVGEPGEIGHHCSGLRVDHLGVGVPAIAPPDALLLELDVPLPSGEQLIDNRFVHGRQGLPDRGPEAARFVDQGAEHVEDDDLDLHHQSLLRRR